MNVAAKTVVSLYYTLYDADGKVLDKANDELTYLHGGFGGIFAAVEKALEGKATGDIVRVKLQPDEAFGEYDADLVRMEETSKFPADVRVGMQFEGQSSKTSQTLVYTVTDIADGKVVVDGNHPLAGQALNFECTVGVIRKATREELAHGHVHGPHGHHHH